MLFNHWYVCRWLFFSPFYAENVIFYFFYMPKM